MCGLCGRRLLRRPGGGAGADVYFWGGDYDRGRDVRVYSQRGVESRAVVHPAVRPAQSIGRRKAVNRTTPWTETDLMNL